MRKSLQEESSESTHTGDEAANVERGCGARELGVAGRVDASARGSRGAGARGNGVAGTGGRRRCRVASASGGRGRVAGASGELGRDLSGRVGSLGGGGAGHDGSVLAVRESDGSGHGDDGRALLWMRC